MSEQTCSRCGQPTPETGLAYSTNRGNSKNVCGHCWNQRMRERKRFLANSVVQRLVPAGYTGKIERCRYCGGQVMLFSAWWGPDLHCAQCSREPGRIETMIIDGSLYAKSSGVRL